MDRSAVFVLQDVIARARRAHAILSRPESTEIDRRAVLFTARPPAGCIIIILVVVVTTDQSLTAKRRRRVGSAN